MAITKIFIDEKSGEISIERATKSDSLEQFRKHFRFCRVRVKAGYVTVDKVVEK